MTVSKTENKQANGSHKLTKAGPGRPAGSKDKFTNLKQAYLDVFDNIEKKSLKKDSAIKSFFQWATKNDRNQGMFYQMVAKMLPTNLTGDLLPDVDGKLTITIIRTKSKDEDNGK